MAKTDHVDNGANGGRGTQVLAAFMDTIYLTDGGHKHDGVNEDGHSSKIDLAEHTTGSISLAEQVTGILPFESVEAHVHTTVGAGLVSLQDHVTGILGVERAWNTKQLVNLTFEGFSSAGGCSLVCLKSTKDTTNAIGIAYEMVLLHFFGMLGVSNGTGFETAVGALPAAFRPPVYNVSHNVLVQNDSLSYPGVVTIQTNGTIIVRRHPSYPNNIGHAESLFSASGNKGFHMFSTTYLITY